MADIMESRAVPSHNSLPRKNWIFGILEDHKLAHVPGTANVYADKQLETASALESNLKKDRTNTIVLVPQPSDDPNDPLNWPLWKRDLILFILSITAVFATTLSPILAANTLTLSLDFGRTFDQMALLTGYHLLAVGISGFFFVPSSRIWGKRHALLLGTVTLIWSSAWAGASKTSYTSLLLARVFQGIGLAPFEALVNAAVGDLYFVHERGVRMAVSNFAVFGGSFMTPVVVGKMTYTLGWPWTFYFVAIFLGIALPFVIFFVPETAFTRPDYLNTDYTQSAAAGSELSHAKLRDSVETTELKSGSPEPRGKKGVVAAIMTAGQPEPHVKKTLLQRIAPFDGRKTHDSYWKLLLRPFPLFFHPAILWACLIQGVIIGWTVFLGIVIAAIMLGPPLWFNEVTTGYMYAGAFIGAVVGFFIAGLLSDLIPRILTRWNNGVYEPEFRLFLVIPQLILGCAGLYGFGITAADTYKYGWFWPDFFFALEVAGMVVGAVASSCYIVDAYRDLAIEAFTCMMIFKNVFSFGLTWSGYQWLLEANIKPLFVAAASVQVGICFLTVPMCKFCPLP